MPEQPPTLRDMIQAALDGGLTLRQLEERAVDPRTAETVSKDTINKIALGRINRMPVESHLRAIAAALGTSYERVRQAAIAEWIPSDNDPTNEVRAEIAELRAEALRLTARAEDLARRAARDPERESA